MARLVTVLLQRTDDSIPWGFRIQGGADYNQPLSVQRVSPGSLASQQLTSGDVLIMIEGQDARLMCHFDACELIKSAGSSVELVVRKANSKYLCAENLVQQEKLEQQIIEERFRQEEEKSRKKCQRETLSPPFGSDSSRSTSFSPHSIPAACTSPQTKAMSPVPAQDFPGTTLQPSCYEVSPFIAQYPPQQNHKIERMPSQASSSSTPRSNLQHSVPSGTEALLNLGNTPQGPQNTTSPPFSSHLSYQPNHSSHPYSPPVSISLKLPPISPPFLQTLPKPFVTVPQPNYSWKFAHSQPSNIQEKAASEGAWNNVECVSQVKPVSVVPSSVASSFTNQLQRPFRAQTPVSTTHPPQRPEMYAFQRQELSRASREISSHIKSPPQRIISPHSIQRRASASPQRVIPPLPKTVFPEDKPDHSKFSLPLYQQPAQTNQETALYSSKVMQSTDAKGDSLEYATHPYHLPHPTQSHQLTNPKLFSPPVHSYTDFQSIKTISSPPIYDFSAPNLSAPAVQTAPSQSFQYTGTEFQQHQENAEINPHLLSKKLQALQQSEDISSSSQSSIYAQIESQTSQERRSHSQERDPLTVEEYKQRQLQKLIEEKVRLEEMMMIAKRRQSISETNESPEVKKKEVKEETTILPVSLPVVSQANTIHAKKHEEIQNNENLYENVVKETANEESKLSGEVVYSSSKNPALRQEEEEERLRQENHMRDEKIRRMQERRYEEKLKRNVLRSARDKSCPPLECGAKEHSDPENLEIKDHPESKVSRGRKSRERTRGNERGRIARDRSCPNNIGQKSADDKMVKSESNVVSKDQPSSLARSFISAHLRSLNVGIPIKSQVKGTNLPTGQTQKISPPSSLEKKGNKLKPSDASATQQKGEINVKEKPKDMQTLQQKKYLIEILKKDQQKIQEKFEKKDTTKQQTQGTDKIAETRVKLTPDEFQREAQRWHTELQKQEELNKQEEYRQIEFLQLQEDVNEQKKLRTNKEQERQDHLMQHEENGRKEDQMQELKRQYLIKQESFNKIQESKLRENAIQREAKLKEEQLEIIKKQEKERQEELKKRENYLKLEEEKLIERIIQQEQKRILEERKRKQKSEFDKSLSEVNEPESRNTNEFPNANKDGIKTQQISAADEDKIANLVKVNKEEQITKQEREEEIRIEDLRRQEEEKMKEEVKLYEEYKKHLESRRKVDMYDSDDYASEWETGEEDEDGKKRRGVYLKEKFDELKATSEEELYDAQEKSIRNLERQIRKQKQREMRKNYERRQQCSSDSSKDEKKVSKQFSRDAPATQHRHYSSTGDLRSNPSRTLPITKFSPDPMEFGFRPIETPHSIISRSTGNLMTGGGPSASSIAHVAGAEAGVAAIKKPISRKFYYQEDFTPKEAWDNRFRISSSLEDLQQVSRKPPLPLEAKQKTTKLRHATSEETISKSDRPCEDPRRHTYTEGEDFTDLSNLESLDLDPLDYENLLHEYYAAYYDTYYQSYYKRQQSDLRGGKMMNLGPPPPPPPPPFSTGTSPPARRAPAEVPTKAPAPAQAPVVAPPAALAGAMMKDKKPFTYTPGGINLAEIKSPRMQRRLQRNACMEGVRPSPLAQQPPTPPPGGVPPTIPPHGMIQVLPVPGMGMGPVVKPHQPPKEPPKPKRKVCGPAPPPPPFAIGEGSSSVNASPSTTPASGSAITSITPPTTPSTFSSPPSSLSSAPIENGPKNDWNSCSYGSDQSNLKPLMATEPGPSVPSPPPAPPSSVASQKRFSYPSTSSVSSFVSKPETESSFSPAPSPSALKSPVLSTHTPVKEKYDVHQNKDVDSANLPERNKSLPPVSSSQESKLIANDKSVPVSQKDSPTIMNGECTSETTSQSPENLVSRTPKEQDEQENNETRTTNTVPEKTDIHISNVNATQKDETVSNLIEDEIKIEKEVETTEPKDSEIEEKHDPVTKIEQTEEKGVADEIEEVTNEFNNVNAMEETATENKEKDKEIPQTNEKEIEELKKIPETNEEKIEEVKKVVTKSNDNATEIVAEANKENGNEINETVAEVCEERPKHEDKLPEQRNEVKISDVVETSPKKCIEITNSTAQSESGSEGKSPKLSHISPIQTPKTPPIKEFGLKSPTSKPTNTANIHEKNTPFSFRPAFRMASPPATSERENKAFSHDRLTRQASLPADPISPSSGSKSVNKGSLYIPQVKHSNSDATAKPSAFQGSNSPTSGGLNKAPLPWMCGVRKEPSPPPEFLVHAQKTQERLQRQRSLTKKENNQQQYPYDSQKNGTSINSSPNYQNSFTPSTPYSPSAPVTSLSTQPQLLRNPDSAPQHTWRSPEHQNTTLKRKKKELEQQSHYQQPNLHQQQNSFVKPHSQPLNHQQNILHVFPTQTTQSNTLPRERIIPIMLEDTPPATPTSKGPPSFVVKNFVPSKINPPFQTNYQRQGSWQNSPAPIGTGGGAFSPYESGENYHSSSNALEALQQMQQNLAQLNSGLQTAQNPPQPNGTLHTNNSMMGQDPVTQSRSFRLLQNAYDHQDSTGSDDELWNYMQRQPSTVEGNESQEEHSLIGGQSFQSAIDAQSLNENEKVFMQSTEDTPSQVEFNEFEYSKLFGRDQPSSVSEDSSQYPDEDLSSCCSPTHPRLFKVLQAFTDSPLPFEDGTPVQLEQETQPETKKYTGSSIPSRSFRMLQAMTDSDDVHSDDMKATSRQGKARADEGNTTSSSSFTTPASASSSPSHSISCKNNAAQSLTTSSCHPTSSMLSSGTSLVSSVKQQQPLSGSQNDGEKLHTEDPGTLPESRVTPSYTNIADSPVYRHVIPMIVSPDKGKDERVVNSALSAKRDPSPRPWQRSSGYRDVSPVNMSASRSSASSYSVNVSEKDVSRPDSEKEANERRLYGGSSIPSRVFQKLRSDYSDPNQSEIQEIHEHPKVRSSRSMTPSSPRLTEVHIPRIMQQLHIDQRHQSLDESTNNEGDQCRNGVLETASAKESVLKELTSQFDPQTNLKKPRAAPGRVFRYLQQQYDDPQDSDFTSMDSLSNWRSSSDNISPSNAHLSSSTSSGTDSGHYEIEPKPYEGSRIPGRTFKMLQDNIGSHPSVLQARPGPGESDL